MKIVSAIGTKQTTTIESTDIRAWVAEQECENPKLPDASSTSESNDTTPGMMEGLYERIISCGECMPCLERKRAESAKLALDNAGRSGTEG